MSFLSKIRMEMNKNDYLIVPRSKIIRRKWNEESLTEFKNNGILIVMKNAMKNPF